MLARILRIFGFNKGSRGKNQAPVLLLPPPEAFQQDIDNGVGHLHEPLDPGAPAREGEPIPRWPEHGAALMAATPDELLATQSDLIRRIRETSPLSSSEFDRMVMPAFQRYAAWVHLLPASEHHHHFGPGGLLRHGFEVALHATRMAEGKHVGVDLPPSTRARYEIRWRVAAMMGGLLHDLGKPLVDCGATDPERTMTWPSHAGDLYGWLKANQLTHYRVYWRGGPRHERHKPVGTAVIREILGPDMLAWLSDEPTQDVMSLLMMSVAGTPSSSNVMSMVVSKADSMSVEADLKRLALRTQATATGGTHSAAGMIMAQLRKMVETNRVTINKPGGQLWVIEDGCFGVFPGLVETIVAQMKREQIPSFPANRSEIAELLVETGFVEACQADTEDGRQRSLTWDVYLQIKRSGEMTISAPIKSLRFTDPQMVFGATPMPAPSSGTARSPFISAADAQRIADQVEVDATPQSAESAVDSVTTAEPPETVQPEGSAEAEQSATAEAPLAGDPPDPPNQAPPAEQPATADEDAVHIADRRNRRDVADERRYQSAQEQKKQVDLREQIRKISKTSLCGPACAEVLRSIFKGALVFGTDYFDTADGLAVAYPRGLEGLGMPPEDVLAGAAENRWVFVEPGSDRKVTERTFPDGSRRKCVIFAGDMAAAWTALCADHPEVLERREQPTAAATQPEPGPARPAPEHQKAPVRSSNSPKATTLQTPPKVDAPARPRDQPKREGAPRVAAGADKARQKKLERPAVGAQPAVGAGARPSAGKRPPPTRPPEVASSAPQARRDQGEGAGSRAPTSIRCNLISELNPQLVANINAAFVLAAEHMAMQGSKYDLARPEDLKAVMRFMVEDAHVRVGPLLTALTTPDNPALLFKMPTNMTIREIKAVRMNPEYKRPPWLVEKLEQARKTMGVAG